MSDSKISTYSISISGLLSWQLHALNNEGNEGNQTLTRRYYILQKDKPDPQYVNGISGDMLKHIQAEHLHRIAIDDENLPLSAGGERFDPDRVGYDFKNNLLQPIIEERKEKKKKKDGTEEETTKKTILLDRTTDLVLQKCTMSDLEGFMIVEKEGKTLKRESTIEFGAVAGIPSRVKTQSYFHAKYGEENPTPYNVQVSSGLYATVLNIEAFRIGYNPHTFTYAISVEERKRRLDALLKSVLYTYLQPNGAKRNTNLPHPDRFEGVISVSSKRCPAPTISPLDDNYLAQIEGLKNTLNQINGENTIQLFKFESIAEFGDRIRELIEQCQPWESDRAEGNE